MNFFLGLKISTDVIFGEITDETVSEAVNLRRQVSTGGAHLWTLTFDIVDDGGNNGEAGAILAAHRDAHGINTPFDMAMLQHLRLTPPAGALALSAAAAQGATSVEVAGGATMPRGWCFSIAGDAKVYRATEARAGDGTLSFRPRLRSPAADGAALDFTPSFQAVYVDREPIRYRRGVVVAHTVELREWV